MNKVFCVCAGCRGLRPGRHLEDDDIVPELAHIHPRERPDWEETISAMVRHILFQVYENCCFLFSKCRKDINSLNQKEAGVLGYQNLQNKTSTFHMYCSCLQLA